MVESTWSLPFFSKKDIHMKNNIRLGKNQLHSQRKQIF